MTIFASDDFSSHTPGDPVQNDADWTRPSWASNNWIVTTASRVRPGGTNSAVYWNMAPSSADYSVSADVFVASVGIGSVGIAARMSTAANTFYWANAERVSNTSLNWRLFKFVAGTATQLGSSVAQTVAASGTYNLKINVSGSTIELYDEGGGSPTISATDTAITAAGFAGIRSNRSDSDSTGYHLTNFVGEEAGGGVTGTFFSTTANDSLASAGSTTIVGTLSRTLASDSLASAGSTTILGSLSRTLADDGLSATGGPGTAIAGSLAATLQGATLAATGTITQVGTLAVTLADASLVASGTTTIVGSLSTTLADARLNSAGYPGLPPEGSFWRFLGVPLNRMGL